MAGRMARVSAVARQRSNGVDLSDIWLFSACSPSQMRTIRQEIKTTTAKAGSVLVEEDTVGRRVLLHPRRHSLCQAQGPEDRDTRTGPLLR